MPRRTAIALIGAGAFSLALAGLVPAAVTPAMLKAPATQDLVTHSRGEAQKLNSATGQLENITVDLTRTLTTSANADGDLVGSGSTAVYNELLNLAVVGPDGEVQTVDARGRYTGLRAGESVIAFDRKSGKGVPDAFGETYGTTAHTVKLPFATQQTTYDFYDQTSKRGWPVDYTRTLEVDGLEVYEFVGSIPEVSLGQYGVLEGTDTLYSNPNRTLLVEPVTGSIVSVVSSPQTSIRFADGTVSPALLVDSLAPTAETVAGRVAEAKDSKSSALMLQRAPWILGVLGLLLLAGGLAASRRRTRADGADGDDGPGSDEPRRDLTHVLPVARGEAPLEQRLAR